MKKCILMFALFVATLLIAAWSNKNQRLDTNHTIASQVDSYSKQLLVQEHTVRKH